MKRYRIHILLTALILAAGCTFIQERIAVKNCVFTFVSARPASFTMTDAYLDVQLDIRNPNSIDVVIDRLDLMLFINDQETVKALFEGQRIPAGTKERVATSLKIPYMTAGTAVISILKSKKIPAYRLDGTVYLKTPIGMTSFPVTIYSSGK